MPDAGIHKQAKQSTEKHSQSNKRYEYVYLIKINVKNFKYRLSLMTALRREGYGNNTCNCNSHPEVHIVNILTTC